VLRSVWVGDGGQSRTERGASLSLAIYCSDRPGGGIILFPLKSLVETMLASQTLNGVLLAVVLITMLRLINDKRIMGKYVNGRLFNVLAWAIGDRIDRADYDPSADELFPGMLRG